MKITRIDGAGLFYAGLRAVGFNVTPESAEVIVQILEFIKKNHEPTLRDVILIEKETVALFNKPEADQ